MTTPLSLDTIDSPAHSQASNDRRRSRRSATTPADRTGRADRHAVAFVSVRLRRQHRVNQHHRQSIMRFTGPSRTRWYPSTRTGIQWYGFPAENDRKILNHPFTHLTLRNSAPANRAARVQVAEDPHQ